MLAVLHSLVLLALWILPSVFMLLLPLLLLSFLVTVSKHGLLLLKRSVHQVQLRDEGWYLRFRDNREVGPLVLPPASRLGHVFIRLRFKGQGGRHVLISRGMVGQELFRKLQVYLRWAPDKQSSAAFSSH